MTWWQSIFLGILQGLTEFLPVSSSGHLALAQMSFEKLGYVFRQPGVVFDAMLHVGTALAVVFAERRQLGRWLTSADGRRLAVLLVIGTAATAVLAFPLRGVATAAFENASVVGLCLIITGVLVFSTRFLPGGEAAEDTMVWFQAVAVGLTQGLAVFPGISRSGTTIATGLAFGLDRAWAARFSFLLSVPAIVGVTVVELITHRGELAAQNASFWGVSLLGGAAAALTGFFALQLVIRLLGSRHFHRFAWYCLPLGAAVLIYRWTVGP